MVIFSLFTQKYVANVVVVVILAELISKYMISSLRVFVTRMYQQAVLLCSLLKFDLQAAVRLSQFTSFFVVHF